MIIAICGGFICLLLFVLWCLLVSGNQEDRARQKALEDSWLEEDLKNDTHKAI